MKPNRIILCADDYAISPGTSRVIADLVRGGRINAVSCMAAMPGWPADAAMLVAASAEQRGVEIGLHLTLSDETPLGPLSCLDSAGRLPDPDKLLRLCLARKIDPAEFTEEIDRQFIAFRQAVGRAPDFVDAHQHVHLYPILRSLVADAVVRHAPAAWVRVPTDTLPAMLSRPFRGKALGSALHAIGFRRLLRRKGLRFNRSFAGHYDFGTGYAGYFARFFAKPSDFHVVMCHPGAGDLAGDSIAPARQSEAIVLSHATIQWQPFSARLAS